MKNEQTTTKDGQTTVTVDFTRLPICDVAGQPAERDIAKELGNYIYNDTPDLGELDLAQRIYREGRVALTDAETETVRRYLERGYKAFVRVAFDRAVRQAQSETEHVEPAES